MQFVSPTQAGGRRRLFAVALAVGCVGALFAFNAMSSAGAVTAPPLSNPPSEKVTQITVNVTATGALSLPNRTTNPCGGAANCPTSLRYTTFKAGMSNLVVRNAGRVALKVHFVRWNGKLTAKEPYAKKQLRVPEGQNLLSVTVGSTTTSLIVWGLTSTPYSDPTAPPSTNTTSSTAGPHAQTFVSVTLDGSGLHAAPATAPAGDVYFTFHDARANQGDGSPRLYLEVQPNLGDQLIGKHGETKSFLLCNHRWFLRVKYDDPTTSTSFDGGGSVLAFDVTGQDGRCTTPVT